MTVGPNTVGKKLPAVFGPAARGFYRHGAVDRVERRLEVRLRHFHDVRMHELQDLFDTRFGPGKIENLLRTRVPREYPAERIVLIGTRVALC